MQHCWPSGAAVTAVKVLAQAIVRQAKEEVEAESAAHIKIVKSNIDVDVIGRA